MNLTYKLKSNAVIGFKWGSDEVWSSNADGASFNFACGRELPPTVITSNLTDSYCLFLGFRIGQNINYARSSAIIGDNNAGVATTMVNSFIWGTQSMAAATSIVEQIAIGYSTLRNYTGQGEDIVAIGFGAAFEHLSGRDSVFIGYYAGQGYLGNPVDSSTGNRSVFIGTTNAIPGAVSESGQMNIQNAIYGRGNDGAWAMTTTGKIGFYQTNPTARVHVTGHTNTEAFRVDFTGGVVGFRIDQSGGVARAGFLGATPIARPTITGSRASNVALANLLTQLANYGLITDSTS